MRLSLYTFFHHPLTPNYEIWDKWYETRGWIFREKLLIQKWSVERIIVQRAAAGQTLISSQTIQPIPQLLKIWLLLPTDFILHNSNSHSPARVICIALLDALSIKGQWLFKQGSTNGCTALVFSTACGALVVVVVWDRSHPSHPIPSHTQVNLWVF